MCASVSVRSAVTRSRRGAVGKGREAARRALAAVPREGGSEGIRAVVVGGITFASLARGRLSFCGAAAVKEPTG